MNDTPNPSGQPLNTKSCQCIELKTGLDDHPQRQNHLKNNHKSPNNQLQWFSYWWNHNQKLHPLLPSSPNKTTTAPAEPSPETEIWECVKQRQTKIKSDSWTPLSMLWPEQIRTKPSTMLGSDGGDFKTLTHLPSYGRCECYSCFDHAVDGGLLRCCLRRHLQILSKKSKNKEMK